jgi:hypothetical protein
MGTGMSIAIEEYQVTGGPPVPGGIAGHGRPLVLRGTAETRHREPLTMLHPCGRILLGH